VHASRSITLCALASLLSGCGKDAHSGLSGTGGSTTGATTTYVGAFASASWSGTMAVAIANGSSQAVGALPTGISAQVAPDAAANASLVFVDGTAATGTGTLSTSTGSLFINGISSGFVLTGGRSGGGLTGMVLSGTVTGVFVASPAPTKVLCGSYAGSSVGFWNIVILSTGDVLGVTATLGTGNTTTLKGTLSGNSITLTSSDSGQALGTLSADGSSVSGTWGGASPNTGSIGSGTFQAGTATCGTSVPGTAPASVPPNLSGSWVTSGAGGANISFAAILQAGSSLSGSGLLYTSPITPISGPTSPAYSGNSYIITSGNLSGSAVTFTAALGGNAGDNAPAPGTLSFTGKFTNAYTLTGTLLFTPPRTASQLFAAQTLSNFTLTKQ
jgi:hypothetical protein